MFLMDPLTGSGLLSLSSVIGSTSPPADPSQHRVKVL